jgi:CHAT domain-containing protein/tetratricopeptide (TPR) repeat protein
MLRPFEIYERVQNGQMDLADVRRYVDSVRHNYHRPELGGVSDSEVGRRIDAYSDWQIRTTELERCLNEKWAEAQRILAADPERAILVSHTGLLLAGLLGPRAEALRGWLLADQLRSLRRHAEAANVFVDAYEKAIESEDQSLVLEMLSALGEALAKSDQRESALSRLREMEFRSRQAALFGYEARACHQIGLILLSRGDTTKSVEALERAVELRERLGEDAARDQLVASLDVFLQALGNACRRAARYEAAVETYQKLIEYSRNVGDGKLEASAVSEIAYTYEAVGQPAKAAGLLERAAQLARASGDAASATRWGIQAAGLGSGSTIAETGLADAPPRNSKEAYLQNVIAEKLLKAARHQNAEAVLRRVFDWAERTMDRELLIPVCNNLGICLSRTGRHSEAVRYFQKGIQSADFISNVPGSVSLRLNLAYAFVSLDKYQLAEDVLRSGIGFCRIHLDRPETTEFRQQVIACSLDLYDLWAGLHSQLAPPEDQASLILITETARARNLYSWARLETLITERRDGIDERRALDLLREYRAAHVKTELSYFAHNAPAPQLKELDSERRRLRTEVERTLAKAGVSSVAFRDLDDFQPSWTIEELAGPALRKTDALVSLFSVKAGICVAVAYWDGGFKTRGEFVPWSREDRLAGIAKGTSTTESRAAGRVASVDPLRSLPMGDGLENPGRGLAAVLSELESRLFSPVVRLLEGLAPESLVVVPHLELALVPYWNLVDRCPSVSRLTLAPSVGVYRLCHERLRSDEGPTTLVPDVTGSLSFAGMETAHVAECRRGMIHSAQSNAEVQRRSQDCSLLHVAGHGLFSADAPYHSGVIVEREARADETDPLRGFAEWRGGRLSVSGGRGEYRLLTVAECLGQLSLNACRLAVLSSCESGVSRQHGGGEMTGLPTAFLVAGAKTVIASLWKVHDAATALMMRYFYENWSGGRGKEPSPATALACARRQLKAVTRNEAIGLLGSSDGLPDGPLPFVDPAYSDAFHCFGSC